MNSTDNRLKCPNWCKSLIWRPHVKVQKYIWSESSINLQFVVSAVVLVLFIIIFYCVSRDLIQQQSNNIWSISQQSYAKSRMNSEHTTKTWIDVRWYRKWRYCTSISFNFSCMFFLLWNISIYQNDHHAQVLQFFMLPGMTRNWALISFRW